MSRAATGAGTAITTASAAHGQLPVVGPVTTSQPCGARRTSRTVTPVSISDAGLAQPLGAGSSGSRPTPPRIPAKTGPRIRLDRPPDLERGGEHRALVLNGLEQPRCAGPHRDVDGPVGVHAEQQRRDQSIDDVRAEATADVLADRDVVTGRRRGPDMVEGQLRERQRTEHPAARERTQVGRDAHDEAARHLEQVTVDEQTRRDERGVDEVVAEAEVADEPDRLGSGREHRLGALVDRQPLELGHPQLPTHLGSLDSSTVTRRSCRARHRNHAAASPEMPPPTTTTCGRRSVAVRALGGGSLSVTAPPCHPASAVAGSRPRQREPVCPRSRPTDDARRRRVGADVEEDPCAGLQSSDHPEAPASPRDRRRRRRPRGPRPRRLRRGHLVHELGGDTAVGRRRRGGPSDRLRRRGQGDRAGADGTARTGDLPADVDVRSLGRRDRRHVGARERRRGRDHRPRHGGCAVRRQHREPGELARRRPPGAAADVRREGVCSAGLVPAAPVGLRVVVDHAAPRQRRGRRVPAGRGRRSARSRRHPAAAPTSRPRSPTSTPGCATPRPRWSGCAR